MAGNPVCARMDTLMPLTTPNPSRARLAGKVLALAGVYFLVARLSLFLAFKDSNASPVWPPSGIAFVALLVLGPRLWPGVFLGAFAANLLAFSAHHGGIHPNTLLVSGSIGLGNSAEALAGALGVRFFVKGDPLAETHKALKFAAVVAAMCLVSAAVGTVSLGLGQLAPWEYLPLIFRT